MKRLWRIVLVGLVILSCMAVPRIAAAQYYGPNVHVWAVGSARYPAFEFIADGQTTTRNPQSGGWIEVYVWQPAGANTDCVTVYLDNRTSVRIGSSEAKYTWWGAVSGYIHHGFVSMGDFRPKTIDVYYVTRTWPSTIRHQVLNVRQP
jgi:hypothetical protein